MKSKCDPSCRSIGARRGQTYIVAQAKGQVNQLHRALDSHTTYLTITLRCMPIANGEKPAHNCYRQVERTAGHQFFAVHVSSAKAWRRGRVYARFVRRHPHHAHERVQSERMPTLISPNHAICVKSPS